MLLITSGATSQEPGAAAGFMFLTGVAVLCLVAVESAMRVAGTTPLTASKVRVLTITTLALVLVVEVVLRYGLTTYATYMEVNGSRYFSVFKPAPSWFPGYEPGVLMYARPEFTHRRTVNSLGLPDVEFTTDKAPQEYRVLALGDSFTEGVGAPQDSTWVKVVGRLLASRHPDRQITTLNAGVSASDPFYAYVLLREKLVPFHPDLVIVAINSTDHDDILLRGGHERFLDDGTVTYRQPPAWEWLYGLSYISRPIIHDVLGYNYIFFRGDEMLRTQEVAAAQLRSVLEDFRDLCRTHAMSLFVVAHPVQHEVMRGTYASTDYQQLMLHLASDATINFVDLLPYYLHENIMTPDTASRFYWPLHYHHTTEGYQHMGEAIAHHLDEMAIVGPASETTGS